MVRDKNFLLISQILVAIIIIAILIAIFKSGKGITLAEIEGKSLGNPEAPVTIVEWSDFECQFCSDFSETTFNQLKVEYISQGDVRFIFKHFPAHESSFSAALASECANEQGAFWEYHDELFKTADRTMGAYLLIAENLELDTVQFDTCLVNETHRSVVEADFQEARSAGVTGTPYFFINELPVEGLAPFASFKALIESELAP